MLTKNRSLVLGTLLCATSFNITAEIVDLVPNRLLVKAKPGFSVADAARPFSGMEVDAIEELEISIIEFQENAFQQAWDGLQRNPNIEFAEPDAITEPAATANDTYYSKEWHLSKVKAQTAWDLTKGSSSVLIAILDTGVDGAHPDLKPKMVAGWNAYSSNTDTRDVNGHGTGVAGAAAAASNNSIGVTGLAWNCKIMPIRISDSTGYATWSTTAKAITWAANHGARVANLSYSGMLGSSAIRTAAQYMQSKRGVVITAAGNSKTFDSSSDHPYILTVSATDTVDALCSFSNTGNNIDLSAPGISIWSTKRGGGYGSWWGTSLSAPVVAGTAALVISANPALSGSQVSQILKNTADDLGAAGWDSKFGKGRINSYRAVKTARSTAGTP
jgi:thermitase